MSVNSKPLRAFSFYTHLTLWWLECPCLKTCHLEQQRSTSKIWNCSTFITLQNRPWPTLTLSTFITITIETLFTIWKANHKPKSKFYSSNFLRTSLSSCFHALVAPRSVGSSVIDNSLTGLGNELGQWQCPHISTLGPAAGPRHSWEIRGHNHQRQH